MKNILPPTTKRVSLHTNLCSNQKIRNQTIGNIIASKRCSEEAIANKLNQLNMEWDTERVLEANAALMVVISTIMGLKQSKFWFLLTGVAGLFLLQHALQGWCPPVPVIRKLGIRTAQEIGNEITVLKMIRKDFMQYYDDAESMLKTAEKH